MVMDISRDAVFVGDSSGYIHVLRLLLKKGQLQPLVLLGRVPPPGWVPTFRAHCEPAAAMLQFCPNRFLCVEPLRLYGCNHELVFSKVPGYVGPGSKTRICVFSVIAL